MPSSVPALRVDVGHERDDTAVVQLHGELDIATSPLLQDGLRELVELLPERPLARLVFDLSDLTFTDVVGLDELLRVERQVAAFGGVVTLRRPPPLVRRVITLLKLEGRLVVAEEA